MADELGVFLRQLRQRSRLTQEQLAERALVSVRTIRRLETGRSTDHRVKTLHLLADALGADPQDRRRLTGILDRPGEGAEQQPPASEPQLKPEPRPVPASVPPPAPAGPVAPASADPVLAEAAVSLAREIRRRWRREEEHRRVHDPFPLPVRWQPVPPDLMDHPENVQRLRPGATATELDLTGEMRKVAEAYRGIASGRLVVLGRAGSGKSVLAIRFVLDLLAGPEPATRVPVIFNLGAWDPTTTALRDFLVDLLLQDHPHLARLLPGSSTLAAALVDADLVLPILDGFDEMAEALREEALRTLNATSAPLVLTSRRDEYAGAVKAVRAPLVWAAGIELTDLTVADLASYLPRAERRPAHHADAPDGWRAVLARLHDDTQPDGTRPSPEPPDLGLAERQLAHALRTPLMVTLARTLYEDANGGAGTTGSEASGRGPAELLDTARFPTVHDLEEHLLAGFVPTLYQRRAPERAESGLRRYDWDPLRARHWLGQLARGLSRSEHDRHAVAWWRLGHTLRVSTRVLHAALMTAVCMAAATWLVQLLTLPTGFLAPLSPRLVLLQGVLVGLLSGTAAAGIAAVLALLDRLTAVPSRVRLRLPAADRRIVPRRIRSFSVRFGLMLPAGAALGVAYAWVLALLGSLAYQGAAAKEGLMEKASEDMLMFGLTFGLPAALVSGLLAVFEAPMDIAAATTPIRLLSVNRAAAMRQLLFLVPLVTLGLALCLLTVVHLIDRPLPPLSHQVPNALLLGSVGGLGCSTSYVFAFTAWGQWLTLTRVWLPLRGRLPWRTVAFLEDAYRRGVLRQAGAVYQFRHVRLEHHLAQTGTPGSPATPTAGTPTSTAAKRP